MNIEEEIKNGQKEIDQVIYQFLQHVIDQEFGSNPAPICSKPGEPNTRNSWERFSDSEGDPELPTMLRWVRNSHARIDLIIPGGFVQRLKEDIATVEDEPFTVLWNYQKRQPDRENCIKFDVCDNSMTSYRKKFPKSFSVLTKFLVGMGIKVVIRKEDPDEADILYPTVLPSDLKDHPEYEPLLQQLWLKHQADCAKIEEH